MASMFFAVSITVSPFDRLLVAAEKSIVSAPRRRAASAKLVSRSGRVLEEQVAVGNTTEDGDLSGSRDEGFFEDLGLVEDRHKFFSRKIFESEQVASGPAFGEWA